MIPERRDRLFDRDAKLTALGLATAAVAALIVGMSGGGWSGAGAGAVLAALLLLLSVFVSGELGPTVAKEQECRLSVPWAILAVVVTVLGRIGDPGGVVEGIDQLGGPGVSIDGTA